MNRSFKLFRLQQIDSQLDRIRLRLNEIEVALQDDQTLQRASQQAKSADQTLAAERKKLSSAERQVQEQRIKIEQNEATLYSGKVRNPKELQDLQNEVASLKRYRSVLEDRQLEAMIAVEEAEIVYAQVEDSLSKAQAEFEQRNQTLLKEQSNLRSEAARFELERVAAASSIPEEDIHLYNQLRQLRNGIAVAKVTDKACAACGSTLNAALLHAARSPNQITRCEICGRILYGG